MRRELAADAEITGGTDEPGSEDLLPEPIHGDASRQGVFASDEPLGQVTVSWLCLYTYQA